MPKQEEPIIWTEAGLKAIRATGRRETYPDPSTPGLVLLMTPTGQRTFYLVYRFPRGRKGKTRWFKLGKLRVDLGLKTARDRAIILRGEIQNGADPQGDRARKVEKAVTVKDLCARFTAEYIATGKVKTSTGAGYQRYIDHDILPAIGALPVAAITGDHVAKLLASVTKGNAPHLKATLSRLFSRAHLWHLRPGLDNPVVGQDSAQGTRREVRLSETQIVALGTVEHPWQAAAMVRLLLLTGMRVGELVGSRPGGIQQRPWATVDLDGWVMVLAPEDHKTGRKTGEKTIYLCREAVAILRALPRESGFVLGGWANPQGSYAAMREALPVLRGTTLHDLRHTFASTGDSLGVSPATVAALLGHAARSQTGRYTHKFSPELAAGAQVIGGHLAGLLA